jgi:serine/threonine-protein kinase
MKTPYDVDGRSDIWSMGAILYQLLTGSLAHDGKSLAEIFAKVLDDKPVSLAERAPDVPLALARIVERCLEKDRERRYPNAAELAVDLRAVLTALPIDAPAAAH